MRIGGLRMAGGVWLLAASAFTGCGGSGTSSVSCGVGAVRPCACPDSSTSTQACDPDSLVWRPCDCGGDDGTAGNPSGAAGAESSGGSAAAGASGADPGDSSGGDVAGVGGDVSSGGTGGSSACNANQYECADGQCIPLFGLCDGVQTDCDDGSDEHPAVCGTGGNAGTPGSGGDGAGGEPGSGGDPGSGGTVVGDGGTGGAGGSAGAGGAIIVVGSGGSQPSLGGSTGLGGSQFNLGGSIGLGGDPFSFGGSTGVGGEPFGMGGEPGSGGTAGAETLNAEVDYIDADGEALMATVLLFNDSGSQIRSSSITIRYWFSLDGYEASEYVFECTYSTPEPCGDVAWQVVPIATGDPSADAYLEISYPSSSGVLYASDQAMLSLYLYVDNWSEFDATNDYSYFTTPYQPWDTLTLYVDGELVWGTPPG